MASALDASAAGNSAEATFRCAGFKCDNNVIVGGPPRVPAQLPAPLLRADRQSLGITMRAYASWPGSTAALLVVGTRACFRTVLTVQAATFMRNTKCCTPHNFHLYPLDVCNKYTGPYPDYSSWTCHTTQAGTVPEALPDFQMQTVKQYPTKER